MIMLEQFKADLQTLSDAKLVNKYYLTSDPVQLEHSKYYTLRQLIADEFNVEFTDVFMVGSGKLGFSIKPTKRFQPFSDTSDLDIAVISKSCFERIWEGAFDFERGGGYWPKSSEFKGYHFNGWIRPDKFPPVQSFQVAAAWWSFFEKISGCGEFGPYKICGGLYYSRYFFDRYQQRCFDQCREEVGK